MINIIVAIFMLFWIKDLCSRSFDLGTFIYLVILLANLAIGIFAIVNITT